MMRNPWLEIPGYDYEQHMSAKNVGQLSVLNGIFKNVINEFRPHSICVLGCTTGNGFEHINPGITKRITGIDINKEYLEILSSRFSELLPLELICGDLSSISLVNYSFDLIHAALVFEYVEVDRTLKNISSWLGKDGKLSVVLQLPSKSSPVSETNYASIKQLSTIIKLVNPADFRIIAANYGLKELKFSEYDLGTGKKFYIAIYEKE